jgi:hypothetical protein
MRRLRLSLSTAVITVVVTLVVLPLLLFVQHDETYTCRSAAIVDVIDSEPEMGADFRREVAFDSGYECNRTARLQVEIAGGILLAGIVAIVVPHRRRRHGLD